ncbi:hypothetical protein BDK92_4687 [Micromonospora pisi]|uniref:DUF4185 domain-containing protein n=1 Tax=Micromonospora pisi TaxID=589240 RepID=A0A495JMW7_9ACTN|nr:hypothetical protein BDK92_4687 [Micromonospora pisi]
MTGAVPTVDLVVAGNEASDLLAVRAPEVLSAYGARRAFWTVLDEAPIDRALALLVQEESGRWAAYPVAADAGVEQGRTEDGEALARFGEWVYVFGSHFGSKAGPLRPRRAFVARFRESDAAVGLLRLQVVRNQFRLHRAVNDVLAGAEITTLAPGDRVRHRFIAETVARGTARAKTWVSRLAPDDLPLNVEGAAFTPSGNLLLGLRFPVTDRGEPILIELSGLVGMFESGGWPHAVRALALTGVTPAGALTGFRALSAQSDGSYAAVIGSIDALGKGSVLLDDHPSGGDVTSRHVRFQLPAEPHATAVPAELVADLAPLHNVEGLAEVDEGHLYVTDEDQRIALWSGLSSDRDVRAAPPRINGRETSW